MVFAIVILLIAGFAGIISALQRLNYNQFIKPNGRNVLLGILVALGVFVFINSTNNTIEEVLQNSNAQPQKVIYKEQVNDDMFVFYLNNNNVGVNLIEKTLFGWKIGNGSSTQFDSVETLSWAWSSLGDYPLSIFYGMIIDPNVTKVEINGLNEDIKIIDTYGKNRLWFAVAQKDFWNNDIVGYSKDGEVLFTNR